MLMMGCIMKWRGGGIHFYSRVGSVFSLRTFLGNCYRDVMWHSYLLKLEFALFLLSLEFWGITCSMLASPLFPHEMVCLLV